MRGIASEIVLIDINRERAQAEASDILHAVPFSHPARVWAGGYSDLSESRIVLITAGVSQQPGQTRLELLGRNAGIMKQIVPQVVEHAQDAVLLVTTNPVDVMTHLVARFAGEYGVSSSRVVGSGTMLDTARFRALLGNYLDVDPQHVHGYVVGEHGDSEVLTWSVVDVGGLPLADYAQLRGIDLGRSVRESIDDRVRNAAYAIIGGKSATNYGIGSALAHLVEVIGHGHRGLLTVCTPVPQVQRVQDVTVSLPHLLGGQGSLATLPLLLSEDENTSLRKSAEIIRDAIDEYDATQ
jgi:L-lactate dehydrogenase